MSTKTVRLWPLANKAILKKEGRPDLKVKLTGWRFLVVPCFQTKSILFGLGSGTSISNVVIGAFMYIRWRKPHIIKSLDWFTEEQINKDIRLVESEIKKFEKVKP